MAEKNQVEVHPVTWLLNVAEVYGNRVTVGSCNKTGAATFILLHDDEEAVKSTVEQTRWAVINGNKCSEAEWCLDTSCPLNKLNPAFYATVAGENLQALRELAASILSSAPTPAKRGPKIIKYSKPILTLKENE